MFKHWQCCAKTHTLPVSSSSSSTPSFSSSSSSSSSNLEQQPNSFISKTCLDSRYIRISVTTIPTARVSY